MADQDERFSAGLRQWGGAKKRQQQREESGEEGASKEGGVSRGNGTRTQRRKGTRKGQSSKLKVDSRFRAMFDDPEFTSGAHRELIQGEAGKDGNGKVTRKATKVDRRGRRIARDKGAEELRRFYEMESSSSSSPSDGDSRQEERAGAERATAERKNTKNPAQNALKKKSDELDNLLLRARGEGSVESSSSSGEGDGSSSSGSGSSLSDDDLSAEFSDSSDGLVPESEPEDSDEDAKTVLIKASTDVKGERVRIGDSSRRLAVMSVDWDNVRATDLLVLFRSFVPTEAVRRVTIFPSEFGKKMMALDRSMGPAAVWKTTREESNAQESTGTVESDTAAAAEEVGAKKESDFDQKRLREYELNKLRYYYAVVECDGKETAEKIYSQCDGMELEHTGNVLDLRYIPDDFDCPPRSEARSSAHKTPRNYDVQEFATNVLQSSNLQCTWDKEVSDAHRARVTLKGISSDLAGQHTRDDPRRESRNRLLNENADKRRLTEDEEAFKNYLAGASDSESSDLSESQSDSGSEAQGSSSASVEESDPRRQERRQKRKQTRDKYRQLLEGGDGDRVDPFSGKMRGADSVYGSDEGEDAFGDMEISFRPGLSAAAQKLVDDKTAESPDVAKNGATEWERRLAKMQEKKQQKKQRMLEKRAERVSQTQSEIREHRDRFSKKRKGKRESEAERKEREDLELLMIPESREEIAEADRIREAKARGANSGAETLEYLRALQESGETLSKRQKRLLKKHQARKRKAGEDTESAVDGFKVDLDDDRFGALFDNPDFAVQRDDKRAKRQSEGVTKRIVEKRIAKRRKTDHGPEEKSASAPVELDQQVARLKSRLRAHPAYAKRN